MTSPARPTPPRMPVFAAGLPLLVIEALQRGEKIQAVRLMREITGAGLKEAKDAVDASPHAAGAARTGLSPGEVPRRPVLWSVVAAALIALALFLGSRSGG